MDKPITFRRRPTVRWTDDTGYDNFPICRRCHRVRLLIQPLRLILFLYLAEPTPTNSRQTCMKRDVMHVPNVSTSRTDGSMGYAYDHICLLLLLSYFINYSSVCAYSMHSLTRKHGHRHSQRLEQQLRYELLHNIEQSVWTNTHTQPQRSPSLTHACVSSSQFDN